MPVQRCRRDGRPGYRWGEQGTCHTYDPDDKTSREKARMRAARQGRAVKANESLTHSDLTQDLQQQLQLVEKPGERGFLWVRDVTSDNEVIYELRDDEGETQTFSRKFTLTEDEDVELADERTPVKRRTRWEPAENLGESYDGTFAFHEASVDRETGIISGVSLLGRVSKNGYSYSKRAMTEAARLHKGANVYLDHPGDNEEEDTRGVRSVKDMAGRVIRSRVQGDRVRGDVQVLHGTSAGETLLALAEQMPDAIGFSHRADGIRSVDDDGRVVVESVTKVHGADVVTEPATVAGLFEGLIERPPRKARSDDMKFDEITLEELKQERPDLVEAVTRESADAQKAAEREQELERLREWKSEREAKDAAVDKAERIITKMKEAGLPKETREDEDVRKQLMECSTEEAEDLAIANLVRAFKIVERSTGRKYTGPVLHEDDPEEHLREGELKPVDGEALEKALATAFA